MIEVSEVRKKLRISHNQLDDDIQDDIDAALLDMDRVGIDTVNPDKLVDKAVELYCKAQFNYLGKGEQFQKNYEELRNALSVSAKYRKADD